MAALRLRMLGDLEVIRGDEPQALPPSRKTRALLAYLALNPRPMRREQLCELLWEIPDDPRGSLRWSLSKIRKLVDDPDSPRIQADRSTVAFDDSAVVIDFNELLDLAGRAPTELDSSSLKQAADTYRGGFLEGLDLPNFHDYYTWCMGQRERVSRAQAQLLQVLLERLADDPVEALEYGQRLVTLQPADEAARAGLIRTLMQLERKDEAQEQFRMGSEKLAELGVEPAGQMYAALQGGRRAAPAPVPATVVELPREQYQLVGRDEELARIGAQIDALATDGGARVLLLRGEPGMGKSSLLRAAAVRARQAGAGLLKASAFESDMVRPFGVWNDALRRALPDNPTSALLGSGRPVSRDVVFSSLSDLLCEECEKRPVVVMCDDVQWCDESSVSAVNHVVRMNRRQPLLVIAASREVELRDNASVQQVLRSLRHDGLLQELRLEPLSATQAEALIAREVEGVDAALLGEECGGNPLLALELARAERDGGSGGSLAELVQDRLARLEEEAEAVLLWASVLSPRIAVDTLVEVTGHPRDSVEQALEAAVQQGVLLPGERGLRFSHDLVLQAVYQQVPAARLQRMHRRVAELLEERAGVDLSLAADLSHHARRSGDPALAVRALVAAGKLCLRFYANDDAMELYRLGLEFAQQLGDAERVCATLELCEIRLSAYPQENWEAEVAEYVALAEQAIDYGALSHARMGYQMASYVRWMHDEVREAQRFSLQAERIARGGTDQAQVLGLGEAAKCLALLERDLSQADAMAMEAAALAERKGVQCATVPLALGMLRFYEDRPEDTVEHLEHARTLAKAAGDRLNEYLANEYLALMEIERGDYAAARGYCDALVAIGLRLREGSEGPFALALQGICAVAQGEQVDLSPLLEDLRRADAKQRLAVTLNRAAQLDLSRGERELARQRAGEALELAQTMERPSEILLAQVTLQQVLSAGGEGGDASLDRLQQLLAGPAAGWARRRARNLLDDS